MKRPLEKGMTNHFSILASKTSCTILKIWHWKMNPQVSTCPNATGEEQRNSSRKNEEVEPKLKLSPVVDVSAGKSKIWCYKGQYCIGTWNVRSMNKGKLEVIKQEMARGNIDILGISEFKCMAAGEFNSDDHYIYYCGQESLRRHRVALRVNKRL